MNNVYAYRVDNIRFSLTYEKRRLWIYIFLNVQMYTILYDNFADFVLWSVDFYYFSFIA